MPGAVLFLADSTALSNSKIVKSCSSSSRSFSEMAEFWLLADWPPYSPKLNSLDFETRHVLQAKAQARPHSNFSALRPSITAE
jgi:hypothetical protein